MARPAQATDATPPGAFAIPAQAISPAPAPPSIASLFKLEERPGEVSSFDREPAPNGVGRLYVAGTVARAPAFAAAALGGMSSWTGLRAKSRAAFVGRLRSRHCFGSALTAEEAWL